MTDVLEHAKDAGRNARENARPLSECPTYAIGELGDGWRRAWRAGWEERDGELRRERYG